MAIDPADVVHVTGSDGLVSTIAPAQQSTPRIPGIVNAAAGQFSGRVAPGEVISIYGYGLGPTTPAIAMPGASAFPTQLGGVQVLVNGVPIPLLYVSDSQINAQIPAPLGNLDNAVVRMVNGSATFPDLRSSVDASIFGVFQNPDGTAKAINQDGTLNSSSNPAKAGTIVSIWATGFGGNSGPTVDGHIATVANNWCGYCQIAVEGINATTAYAGAAPGLIDGVMQINFTVPPQPGFISNPVFLDFFGACRDFVCIPMNGTPPDPGPTCRLKL